MELKNEKIRSYSFLKTMYEDSYFPNPLVDKGKAILLNLCNNIEKEQPKDLDELYELSNDSTEEFNELQEEFYDNDSEIETGARECIAMDFDFIARTYGFDAEIEELIGSRDW